MKKLLLIRHGVTEMNEILHGIAWGSPNFVDARLFDTKLSKRGFKECQLRHEELVVDGNSKFELDKLELLVCSPLTRTLQTAELIFNSKAELLPPNIVKLVHPLFRERLYLSSDVGRQKEELQKEFLMGWDWSFLPDQANWWYENTSSDYVEWRPPGEYACAGETDDIFRARLQSVLDWVSTRPEKYIAIVTHWGILRGLTGLSFENCEMKVIDYENILKKPFVD